MEAESPFVDAIVRSLKEEIARGAFPADRPLPSERDLAERYNAGRAIIRKAVAVLAAENWLHVQPHCRPIVVARESALIAADESLATKADHIFVWLWPYVDDLAASLMLRGIQRGLLETGLRTVIGNAPQGAWDEVLQSEKRVLHEVSIDPTCGGAIVYLLGGSASVPSREAKARRMPFVFLDREPPRDVEGDYVGTENVGAAQRIVRHLVELGHRRIAFIMNRDEASTVLDRLKGYRRGLEEAGIAIDEELILQPFRPLESEAVSLNRMVPELMGRPSPPTAIFAVNDTIALNLMDSLRRHGHVVPNTVSVVGFDGVLRWLPGGGSLTTVDQDYVRMGELAAELLIKRICGDAPSACRHILLDAPLRVQGTTAPPNQDHESRPVTGTKVEIQS